MFSADTDFQVFSRVSSFVYGDSHELAHAFLIEDVEGVNGEDLLFDVSGEEATDIVSGETEGHLGEVVGSEGEELSVFGNFIGGEGSPWDFDHSTYHVRNFEQGEFLQHL